jgi:hypothetical protein
MLGDGSYKGPPDANAQFWQPVPQYTGPNIITLNLSPYTGNPETSGNAGPYDAGYRLKPFGISVQATHIEGEKYTAKITLTWDPNGEITYGGSSPDSPVLDLNGVAGRSTGEHERIFHADFARYFITENTLNLLVSGGLRLTARGNYVDGDLASQTAKYTLPRDFNGMGLQNGGVVTLPGISIPTMFTVHLRGGGTDEMRAASIIQNNLQVTLGAYLQRQTSYAFTLMAHGPGYEVESINGVIATPYHRESSRNPPYWITPPPPAPKISAELWENK